MNHKLRTGTPHHLEMYSFANYIAYVLYPPLYIAGPIITFNDYMWQVRYYLVDFLIPHPPHSIVAL